MKPNRFCSFLAASVCAVSLTACGGGGSPGSLTDFSLSKSELIVQGGTAATGCRSDVVGTPSEGTATFPVYIFGGAEPFQVRNGNPNKIVINRLANGQPGSTEVGSERVFTITFSGGCFSGDFITVEDQLGRTVTIDLTNEEADAT